MKPASIILFITPGDLLTNYTCSRPRVLSGGRRGRCGHQCCPGHAHRPPLPASAAHRQARLCHPSVGVEDLRGRGEERNRGAARPSAPSPACPWGSQTCSEQICFPPSPFLPVLWRERCLQAGSRGYGRFREREEEKPTSQEEIQAGGTLWQAPSSSMLPQQSQGHPVQFESQINNEHRV